MTKIIIKITKICLVLITVMLVFSNNVYAQVFEEIPIGGRQMGMGEAGVAEAFDANAIFWNPAGLTQLNGQMLATMHQDIYGIGVPYDYISFIKAKQKNSATGFFLSRVNYASALDFDWTEDTLLFSYAGVLNTEKTLSYGINFKYLRVRVPSAGSGNGFGMDIGFLYKLSDKIKIGLMARDPFTTISYSTGNSETLSPHYTLGFNYKYNPVTTMVFDLKDIAAEDPYNLTARFGIERWLDEAIALRLGYIMSDTEEESGFTSGLGLVLGPWKIDYAYDPTRGFQAKTPQRISIIYQIRY